MSTVSCGQDIPLMYNHSTTKVTVRLNGGVSVKEGHNEFPIALFGLGSTSDPLHILGLTGLNMK